MKSTFIISTSALLMLSLSALAAEKVIELSEGKFRFNEGKIQLAIKAKNTSAADKNFKGCARVFDRDGFELVKNSLDEFSAAPGGTEIITLTEPGKEEEFKKIGSLRVYASPYGCIDGPGEAVSNVLEIKVP